MAVSVAVVTRRAGLTLTLNSPQHRFREVRPSPGWEEEQWPDEVVVLDLGPYDTTISAITRLRLLGCSQPLVAIVPTGEDARQLHEDHPEVRVTTLPVSPPTLLDEIEIALAAAQPADRIEATELDLTTEASATGLGRALAAGRPTSPTGDDAWGGSVETVKTAKPTLLKTRAESTGDQPLSISRIPAARTPVSLAEQLLSLLDVSLTVPDAAEALRVEATLPVRTEASAVLVPDGDVLRVAAGEGLRPLEKRIQVPNTHWIVSEVADERAILIEDTDIARGRLGGLPLTSWTQLMVVPIPSVGGVLILARTDSPFGKRDLEAVSNRVESSAGNLTDAMVVRRLARALAEFSDPVD